MKAILIFLVRSFVLFNVFTFTWLVTFFGFDQSGWGAFLWGTMASGVTYLALNWRKKRKLLKDNQLSTKEYQYIKKNLKEAQTKINRLNKTLFSVRSIYAIKQIGSLQRLVSKIFNIVREEPKRFYQAERFFFYHLDSIVELSERYTYLTKQRVKDQEVQVSLTETKRTLEELNKSVEKDLVTVLSNDIEHLNIELDVAKQSLGRDHLFLPKERR